MIATKTRPADPWSSFRRDRGPVDLLCSLCAQKMSYIAGRHGHDLLAYLSERMPRPATGAPTLKYFGFR